MLSKSFISFMALWLSFNLCLAEEPTFTLQTENGEDDLSNQFIIQFKRNRNGEQSKQSLFSRMNDDSDDDTPKLIRRIEGRNISVVKFRSRQAAAKWLKNAKGIKYFEKGKKI